MIKEYRTSLYLDQETKEKLSFLVGKLHRSKNNVISFLINDYFDNSIDFDSIDKKLNRINENIELDREAINKAVYND